MTIRTTDTKQVITIELRVWDGTQWGPDCFGDLECNFASSYETDSFCNVIAPKADVDALISWWENEISNANTIPDYEGDGLSSDWQGREYSLFVDVEPDIASIVEAKELARKIRESDQWNIELLKELCICAGMLDEWEKADGDTFERVAIAAADRLGVEII